MALPALGPAVAFVGRSIASWGVFSGAKKALSKIGPKMKGATNWLADNIPFVGGAAVGGAGSWGLNELFDSLGIESERLRLLSMGVIAIAAIAAIGQLFDIQLGGS